MGLDKIKEEAIVFELLPAEKRDYLRLEFIEKFPLDNIQDLEVDEFVQGTDENSFCYWLEFKKIPFGIGGGNASKFGLYKSKEDEKYYKGFWKNKVELKGVDLKNYFEQIKSSIIEILKLAKEDRISEIKNVDTPIWNMILQKILCIYFPKKFLLFGASDVILTCARDIELKGFDLIDENLIEINHECRKLISSESDFSSWDSENLGYLLWGIYYKEAKRNYYIIGSKYGPENTIDIFPEMKEKSVLAVGFADHIDLTEVYGKKKKEIVDFLQKNGEDSNSQYALKNFLSLKLGDMVAIKASGSPKGSKGFLSIIGVAEVVERDGVIYRYAPGGLGHLVNVKFIKAPVYKEFDLGGYGRTIHKLSKTDHIDLIFKSDYDLIDIKSILKDYRQEFIQWLTEKYGDNSGTTSSYIKAIDILSKILSKELFTTTDEQFLDELYKDLIKEQRNQNNKYYQQDAPSYGNNGFYSASINAYCEFLKSINHSKIKLNNKIMNLSLNTILYGPPGTGKTYKLKNEFFERFTDKISIQTEDEFLQELVINYSWWEVIGAILYDLRKVKVKDIAEHPLLKAKSSISSNNNIRATLWGTLQAHTIEGCENVNVKVRQSPQIFNKTKDSNWEIIKENLEAEAPEIIELVSRSKQFKQTIKKKKRYVFTTFHQSFSYEDFIEGIKPIIYEDEQNPEKGKQIIYDIKPGVFKQIAKEANEDRDNDYAIFIDEINRGNIANIFGELITLIEDDKRIDTENYIPAKLPYSNEEFGVPPNLYIIGTMNTADRSVEALDTALRRRFSFIAMNPEPKKLSSDEFKCVDIDLEALLKAINARIEKLLDKDYCIGHSYFMTIKNRQKPLDELKTIFQNKILPLLQEYFYGDWGKIMLVLGKEFVESKKDTIKFLSTDSYEDFEEYDEKPIYNFTNPSSWKLDSFKSIYE